MPNITTHMFIATRLNPNVSMEYLLGSALPDFVGMARDLHNSPVLLRDFVDTAFSDGIEFHKRTDDVYDELPLNTWLIGRARADLQWLQPLKHGGPWRACSDAGTEMLLDGVLLEQLPEMRDIVDSMKDYVTTSKTLPGLLGRAALTDTIVNYYKRGGPEVYADPLKLATLMQKRFAVRHGGKYLAFPEKDVPQVAVAFAAQQVRLREFGCRLVDRMYDDLAPHTRNRFRAPARRQMISLGR